VDRVPQGIHPGHLIRQELHDGADACGAQHKRVGEDGKGGEFLRQVEQPVPKAKPDRENGRVETDSGEERDPRHRSKERERLHCLAEVDETGTDCAGDTLGLLRADDHHRLVDLSTPADAAPRFGWMFSGSRTFIVLSLY